MDEEPQTETDSHPEAPPPSQPPASRPTRRERRHHRNLKLLFGGAAALVLLLAAGAYWFFLRDESGTPAKTTAPTSDQQADKSPIVEPDPTPVAYKSTKLNIELTHRKDWTLKEAADGQLTITSPPTPYTTADGGAASNVFTVKIRRGVPDAMKTTIESAVAARKSEVIAYTHPTKEQRQYTNLSYAGQKKDVFNFFIVTGNNDYKAGATYAYSLSLDGQFYLIVGGYGADEADMLGFDAVPASAMDSSTLTQALDIVESLKIY